MKKLFALLLTALLLCGCGKEESVDTLPVETTTAPTETTAATESPTVPSPELDAYGAVLCGTLSFTDVATGNLLDVTRLGETVTTEDIPCSVRQLAVLDLDRDGTEEAVLWLKLGQDDYAGFVILRYYDGAMYGYPKSYRSFLELKEDGTFRLSGGASYSGFGIISFSQSIGTVFPLAEAETEYLADGTSSTLYRINGESAAEADYQAFEETQSAKADAVWYESWEDFLNSQSK